MNEEQTQIVNEHLRQNATSDTAEEIRRRRREAELAAERAEADKAKDQAAPTRR